MTTTQTVTEREAPQTYRRVPGILGTYLMEEKKTIAIAPTGLDRQTVAMLAASPKMLFACRAAEQLLAVQAGYHQTPEEKELFALFTEIISAIDEATTGGVL